MFSYRDMIAQALAARGGKMPAQAPVVPGPSSGGALSPVINTVHNAFQQGPVGQVLNSPVMQPYFNAIKSGFQQGPVGQFMNAPVMQPYFNAIKSGFQQSPITQLTGTFAPPGGGGGGKNSAVTPPAPTS